MKRTVIILLSMLISVITWGQEKQQFSSKTIEVNMSPPRFVGNSKLSTVANENRFGSLNDYVARHIQIPEVSREFQEEGTEVIQFVVTPKGEVTGFNIINSLSPDIDKEIIRVLKTTNGLWRPGLNNGEPVEMGKELSINFKLSNGDDGTNFVEIAKIFFKKGNRQLLVKANLKGAINNYNKAMRYLPNDKCLLATRGICKYGLGDKTGACQDWSRIKVLGGLESDFYLEKLCEHAGYAEMINILQEKK
ncbi:MAG: energy transducer TonB [Mariniphaga sp.]